MLKVGLLASPSDAPLELLVQELLVLEYHVQGVDDDCENDDDVVYGDDVGASERALMARCSRAGSPCTVNCAEGGIPGGAPESGTKMLQTEQGKTYMDWCAEKEAWYVRCFVIVAANVGEKYWQLVEASIHRTCKRSTIESESVHQLQPAQTENYCD